MYTNSVANKLVEIKTKCLNAVYNYVIIIGCGLDVTLRHIQP